MTRLPALTYREVVQRLRAAGFIFDRQAKGSHEIWYNAARLRGLADEHFRVAYLNRRGRLLEDVLIAEGTVDNVHPPLRSIIARALQANASALIAAHNHPSGAAEPSPADQQLTRDLLTVCRPLGVKVLDHVIVAASMLNEGWDVKRVFQIVPHEERAFNSKLLIAQVLGRGLRVPAGWQGSQPEVTVFNHEAWAPQIRHLVNEVLEMEKRLSSYSLEDSPYHFELHNIEYRWEPSGIKKPMDREYDYFAKGYVDLATDYAVEDVTIEFERAVSEDQYQWQTQIQHRPYTPREIAVVQMYERFQEAQDPDDPDPAMRTVYTDRFPVERLEKIVTDSLARINATIATERMKQTFLQSLGTLSRKTSEYVRYTPSPTRFYLISTQERQSDSVSAAELKRDKTIFVTDRTRATLQDEQVEFFDQVAEQDSGFRRYWVQNVYGFKTPLNAAIADSQNERQFIRMLLKPANLPHCDAWIKSTAVRFYEIEYFWKKYDQRRNSGQTG